MEGTMATIVMFAGNFAPRTWALCQGQLLAISSNSALFSLLGVTYGGDGRTTFGLPDLRGRVPVGTGSGPGFTNRLLGARSGVEYNNLTVAHLPAHTHSTTRASISNYKSNGNNNSNVIEQYQSSNQTN